VHYQFFTLLVKYNFSYFCGDIAVQDDSVPPPNWQTPVWRLNGNSSENNGYENEDLIVWMRNAALPTFRKLYRRINQSGLFQNGLPKGNYSLTVSYSTFLSSTNLYGWHRKLVPERCTDAHDQNCTAWLVGCVRKV